VRFFVLDALGDALPTGYDVVSCSLFLHHLDGSDAVDLLRRMGAAAGRLVLVDDHPAGGLSPGPAGCHLLTGPGSFTSTVRSRRGRV
jgi:hypothetical protein